MYIDKYKVEIKGNKYHEKTDKKMTDQVLATYESNDGMNIKKLMNILEELADNHDANHNITFNIVMKQYDHD
jgi:cation transport regulator ChaC